MPIAIFLLVAAVTLLSVFAIERGERARENAELDRKAQSMAGAIERRGYSTSSSLRAAAALFGAQEQVDSELFRQFVSQLEVGANYVGAEGIGWAPAISAREADALERELDAVNFGAITITPGLEYAPRNQLVPVQFLQPDTLRNRRAIGFDMYSEPVRRAAMDRATTTGLPTASGKVTLVQEGEGGDAAGFIVYMPVFDGIGDERSLRGFIYSPYNAEQFLDAASELVMDEEASIRFFDIEDSGRTLLAETQGWTGDAATAGREIELGGRQMLVMVESRRDSTLSTLSMITLLFGLAVASLLLVLARLLTQQAQEDRRSLEWFAQQNSIRNSLTRELNHRVKNTLANVLSIVSLTRRRADSLDEFADGIDNRIRALSATHDLLTQSEWGTTPIRSVVEVELAPYANAEEHELVLEGPDVDLKPNDALSLGLAIHELATNAAKYGALSRNGGKVAVKWDLVHDALARVEWIESNGPVVSKPDKRGFGADLIEKIVAHELRHPVELDFLPEGVRCVLLVPVREPRPFELRTDRLQSAPSAKP